MVLAQDDDEVRRGPGPAGWPGRLPGAQVAHGHGSNLDVKILAELQTRRALIRIQKTAQSIHPVFPPSYMHWGHIAVIPAACVLPMPIWRRKIRPGRTDRP